MSKKQKHWNYSLTICNTVNGKCETREGAADQAWDLEADIITDAHLFESCDDWFDVRYDDDDEDA